MRLTRRGRFVLGGVATGLAGAVAATVLVTGGHDVAPAGATAAAADPAQSPTSRGKDATTPAEPDASVWPLTGLPVAGDDDPGAPVIVVKIDNSPASAPQRGLGSADLVVEELVEGGSTRLAAFFHGTTPAGPEAAGPVRSMRATDIGIVAPAGGTIATSGAAGVTVERIHDADLRFRSEGSPGFARSDARSAPYNLFADVAAVAESVAKSRARRDAGAGIAAPYLPFGTDPLPAGSPASGLTASFSGAHDTVWRQDGSGYAVVDAYAAPEDRFVADTVLVLRVAVRDAGYLDPAGNPVPESRLVGDGAAMLFHDGEVVRGRWSKDRLAGPLELTADGATLTVPPGRTWIELVPAVGGDVTVTR